VPAADASDAAPRALGLLHQGFRFDEKSGTRVGQFCAVREATEEGRAEFVLECFDLLAERRLRDAEPLGRACKVVRLRDGEKIPDVPQFHAISITYIERTMRY
jgi:hypothetical protein